MSGHIHSLDNFIMMEDLRKTYGFRMTNRREALDLDHTKLVISALAKVHALSWAYRHHVEENITEKFPCLVTNMEEDDMETWNAVLFSNLDQAKLIYDEQFGPGNDYSIAADAFRKILPTLTKFFMGRIDAKLLEDLMRVKCPDPVKFGRDAENPGTNDTHLLGLILELGKFACKMIIIIGITKFSKLHLFIIYKF